MSQFTVETKLIQGLALSVRPVSYEADGLMSLLWVKAGVMYSFYKNVLLSTPCQLPDFMVEAGPFVKLVKAAKSKEIKFNITDGGNLTASAGKLRTRMSLISEAVPDAPVVTSWSAVHPGLLKTLTDMAKLVPDAAPQLWATTLLFRHGHAYASNGIYLVRQKLQTDFEFECALVRPLLDIMVKLKAEPVSIAYAGNMMHFSVTGNVNLSCPVTTHKWPDVSKLFVAQYSMSPITDEFKEVVSQLQSYNEGAAILRLNAPATGVVRFPTDQLANQVVDVSFDSTVFPRNLNLNLNDLARFVKDSSFIGYGNKLIVLDDTERTIILSETH